MARAGGSARSALWFAAPVVGLIAVLLLCLSIPSEPCVDGTAFWSPDPSYRETAAIVVTALSIAIGVLAANRWARFRRLEGGSMTSYLELGALLGLLAGAACLWFVPSVRVAWTWVSFLGLAVGLFGFVNTFYRVREDAEVDAGGRELTIYYGASALFVYPFCVLFALHYSKHPVCFG